MNIKYKTQKNKEAAGTGERYSKIDKASAKVYKAPALVDKTTALVEEASAKVYKYSAIIDKTTAPIDKTISNRLLNTKYSILLPPFPFPKLNI